MLEFARSRLFDPLGIDTEPVTEPMASEHNLQPYSVADFVWPVDIQGLHLGWSGLKLRPGDMAKLGNLYLNGGVWKGRRIVPADWVRDATTSHVNTPGLAPPDGSYGYEWWVAPGCCQTGVMGEARIVSTSAGPVEIVQVPGERPPALFFPGGHCSAKCDCGWGLYTESGHAVVSFSRPGYGGTVSARSAPQNSHRWFVKCANNLISL